MSYSWHIWWCEFAQCMVEIQGTAFGKCFTYGANGVPIIATAYARDKYWA
ncbi:MAG: hypothetical protein RSE33_15650 [Hafnia sp.]